MSGHLDGPPPGPPDPPYIPGDLGAPSAEEFARRRASSEPRPEVRDCPLMHGAAPCPMCAYCPHGLTAGRGADERCLECGAAVTEPRPENPYRTVHARMSPPGAAWDEGFASRQPEIDRLEAERDEARLETWRIVHKCPSCDRYFDSPSICSDGTYTVEQLERVPDGTWPDQSAQHGVLLDQIKDAYAEGIADTIDRLRVRAAEMLPEVARFTLDEIEVAAAATSDPPDEEAIRCDERERLSARVYGNGWCPTCGRAVSAGSDGEDR